MRPGILNKAGKCNLTPPYGGGKMVSVMLSGYILDDGGSPVTERGFYYGSTPSLGKQVISADTAESFSAEITFSGSVLYYQAYAVNESGVSTAEVKSVIL